MDNNSLIILKDKRIEYLRKIYKFGEDDNFLPSDIVDIMNARKELVYNIGLIDYNDKIIYITKETSKKKELDERYNVIYYIFTKCFDFILSHDGISLLKEKYIHYINLLYNFLTKENNGFEKPEISINMFNTIKLLTFDIQSIMFSVYFKENGVN